MTLTIPNWPIYAIVTLLWAVTFLALIWCLLQLFYRVVVDRKFWQPVAAWIACRQYGGLENWTEHQFSTFERGLRKNNSYLHNRIKGFFNR